MSLTLAQALAQARSAGLPPLEARMLLLHALGRSPHERAWLIAHDDALLDAAQRARWDDLTRQRLAGVPVAYLTGHKAFHGLELQVDARALDPRDDTETLVDWALELLPQNPPEIPPAAPHTPSPSNSPATPPARQPPPPPPRLLDLGTGSGAIALAIARQRPAARISATDANPAALALARANGQRLQLPVHWRQGAWGDWFKPLAPGEQFDLIVSNPPYIAEGDPHLPALAHEPRTALISGPDGLTDLRRIIAGAPTHLAPGGWLLLEHGHDQAPAVRTLLAQAGFEQIQSRRDLAGIERCSGGKRPSMP